MSECDHRIKVRNVYQEIAFIVECEECGETFTPEQMEVMLNEYGILLRAFQDVNQTVLKHARVLARTRSRTTNRKALLEEAVDVCFDVLALNGLEQLVMDKLNMLHKLREDKVRRSSNPSPEVKR